jgi:hypothetical protein
MIADTVILTTFNINNINELRHLVVAGFGDPDHTTLLGDVGFHGAVVDSGETFEDAVTKAKKLINTL